MADFGGNCVMNHDEMQWKLGNKSTLGNIAAIIGIVVVGMFICDGGREW